MNVVKKLLNILLIMFGVILIIFCADLVVNKLAKTELDALDETDKAAIEELCAMTELFDDKYGNDSVWTEDYNLHKQPVVITRRYGLVKGSTYAVNMTFSKNVFAQRIKMPDEYSDIPVYRLAYLYPQTFELAKLEDGVFTEVAETRAYTSTFDQSSVRMNGTGSLEENVVEDTFREMVESVDVPAWSDSNAFDVTEENVALMGLQYRILDEMLAADSPEKLNEYIAEYVKVRELQAEKYPDFVDRRAASEIKDGCAKHVFYNISKLINHNITYFNKEESESITFYSAYYYLCTGRYNSDIGEFLNNTGDAYSGAALCRIIADNELEENWQYKIDGSKYISPYTIVKRYCDKYCGKYADKTVDDIKRTYNYEEIISMARTLCKEIG